MIKSFKLTALMLCIFPQIASAQLCNPTENWLRTNFPGENARHMTEMNGKLYTVDFHTGRQEYVLFQFDGFNWVDVSSIPVGGHNFGLITYHNQIYLGGTFGSHSTNIPNTGGIIRWDSASNQWLEVGGGLDGYIYAMEVYNGESELGTGNQKLPNFFLLSREI